MPNEYSVQTHNFVSRKISLAESERNKARELGDKSAESYWNGQIDELEWFRSYLKEHIDLKGYDYY